MRLPGFSEFTFPMGSMRLPSRPRSDKERSEGLCREKAAGMDYRESAAWSAHVPHHPVAAHSVRGALAHSLRCLHRANLRLARLISLTPVKDAEPNIRNN